MNVIEPTRQEREFLLEELFFSITDHRGVIEKANDVFVRISGHLPENLVGAPHSIIRHPDMPRAVFKLLWDYIQSGKTVVAYVKNMAADGSYYWVLALVTPLGDRYLSIRLKPSSKYFPAVVPLYKQMRDIELDKGDRGDARKLGMQLSTDFLVKQLAGLGFDSYDSFMQQMLREELLSRDEQLKNQDCVSSLAKRSEATQKSKHVNSISTVYSKLSDLFGDLNGYVNVNDELRDKSRFLLAFGETLSLTAMNSSIKATRLGNDGRALAIVAQHLNTSAVAVSELADALLADITGFTKYLIESISRISMARLQVEMLLDYAVTAASAGLQEQVEGFAGGILEDLTSVVVSQLHQIQHVVERVNHQASELLARNQALSKSAITLNFSQLIGSVESARLTDVTAFRQMFDEVKSQLEHAQEQLQLIAGLSKELSTKVSVVPRAVGEALTRLASVSSEA